MSASRPESPSLPAFRGESTRHQLARRLLSHPTIVLSGARLARELGVSRSTIWREIEALRRAGVRLKGEPATGYRLEAAPDLLLPELVAPHLRGHWGRDIRHFFVLDSTQNAAVNAARAEAPEGAVFVAEEQTAGRGRREHQWSSPPGAGIYCSLVLRPQSPPGSLLSLTLASGLALREALREACGLEPELRWPNDLLFAGRKLGGILLEMSAEATRIQYAVLGFGINAGPMDFPGELKDLATSLAHHCARVPARAVLLAAALERLEARYRQCQSREGAAGIREEFEKTSPYARGLRVRVGEGHEVWTGVTQGLDEQGFLRVRRDDGREEIVYNGPVRPV